jgi:hypothetical protein
MANTVLFAEIPRLVKLLHQQLLVGAATGGRGSWAGNCPIKKTECFHNDLITGGLAIS